MLWPMADPSDSTARTLYAPPAPSGTPAYRLPGEDAAPPVDPRPRVDERLAEPETREEFFEGRPLQAMPSDPPHGDRHCELDYVVRAHVRDGYVSSSDMLTRVDAGSDFATDTSVRRVGTDPDSDARYLEELSFEVVHKQSQAHVTRRARSLVRRGVRRVFAVMVKHHEVREWSALRDEWRVLDPEATIADQALARPVKVRALLDAGAADTATAEALWAKGEPFLVALRDAGETEGMAKGEAVGMAKGEAVGMAKGLAEGQTRVLGRAILRVLAVRGLEPSAALKARVLACQDLEQLERWHDRALVIEALDQLLDEPGAEG